MDWDSHLPNAQGGVKEGMERLEMTNQYLGSDHSLAGNWASTRSPSFRNQGKWIFEWRKSRLKCEILFYKVGWTCFVTWTIRWDEVNKLREVASNYRKMCQAKATSDFGRRYLMPWSIWQISYLALSCYISDFSKGDRVDWVQPNAIPDHWHLIVHRIEFADFYSRRLQKWDKKWLIRLETGLIFWSPKDEWKHTSTNYSLWDEELWLIWKKNM
jgi:hypothetical protein